MKSKKLFYYASVVLLALNYACSNDDVHTYEPKSTLVFDSNLKGFSPSTRAFDTQWEANDAIGIFMTKGAGLSQIVDNAANKHFFSLNGDGKFWNKDANNAIRYPESGDVNFIAYYPYTQNLEGNNYKIDVANQSNLSKIDLLYSDNAKNLNSSTAAPALTFTHQLSKLVFNVNATTALTSIDAFTVKVTNLPTEGEFDLSTATLTTNSSSNNEVTLNTSIDSSKPLEVLSQGILLPITASSRKVIFTVTSQGASKTTEWDASSIVLEAGKKHTFNVTVNSNLGVLVNPSSTIEDWDNGTGGDLDINFDENSTSTPGGGGTTVTPPPTGTEQEKVVLAETFGTPAKVGTKWPYVGDYTGYDVTSGFTYSDPYGTWADVRYVSSIAHIWFPAYTATADKESGFKIEGIPANSKNIQLEYEISANGDATTDVIEILANGVKVNVPTATVNKSGYIPVTTTIPDNTTSIEFHSGSTNTVGMRVANIKITVNKK